MLWVVVGFFRSLWWVIYLYLCLMNRGEYIYIFILCFYVILSNLVCISKDWYCVVWRLWWYWVYMIRLCVLKEVIVSWLLSVMIVILVFILIWLLLEKRFIVYVVGIIFYFGCLIIIIICYIGIFVVNKRYNSFMF